MASPDASGTTMSAGLLLEAAPRAFSNAVIGTAVYIAAALMFFGGLISAYLVVRAGAGVWPPSGQPRLPILVSALNTLVLFASGALAYRAWRAAPASSLQALRRAALLGVLFLVVQGFEWTRLLLYGLRASTSYGATFYTIIGAHALHALGGLVALFVTMQHVRRGSGDVAACSLYWGFVVLLWPVLYALVYVV
jgi:heme/copper-type cytochrome/quinol oxidase subunit 3